MAAARLGLVLLFAVAVFALLLFLTSQPSGICQDCTPGSVPMLLP